jgi:hypothetical protein
LRKKGKRRRTLDNGHTCSECVLATFWTLDKRMFSLLAMEVRAGVRLGLHHWHRTQAALVFTITDGFLDEQLRL